MANATNTPKRALVVIDVQQEYFIGDLPVEYPDPQMSVRNIGRAMDAARANGIPVIVVQHTAPAGAPIFQKGTPHWELHETVKSRGHDHHIEKNMPSVFTGTDAAAWLKEQGVDTLTVTGYMTQNCNASTIYEGMHAGLKMEYLVDASGSVPYTNEAGSATAEEVHRVLSVIFQSNFAAVTTTDAWIVAVQDQAPIAKSNVYVSNVNARKQQMAA
jgi:nicotinamidase-related amidase